MVSATVSNVIRGQSLESHFMPIGELALLIQSFENFLKKLLSVIQISNLLALLILAGWVAK